MDDDLNPEIPDDASELEFLQQEQDIAKFEAGYDEPIDNKFLHNYIGARQMSYGDDELQIIEDTAFSKIMDYMDANDIHYSDIDVYDFIPEDKRLSPYLIFQQGLRNEYYTDDFVEYMIAVTRRTPSGIYDANLDEVIDAPPSHHMAEYALKAADAKGPEAKLIEQAKIIGGEYTDAALKKLKFRKFFMGVSITAKPRDVVIRFVNNLFPGGSYEAYLEESQRVAMEKMGMTPEGDWLPEVKEKIIIKTTDIDGNVTYTDFYGNEVSPDDPRISDKSKLEDLEEQFKTPMEDLPPEEQVKRMVDEGILTEYEGEQALDKKGNWAVREIDDISVKGIFTSTPTDVRGPSFVYAEIREIEDFIEYNRRDLPAYGTSDALIDDIKQTIKKRGYVFDTDEVYRSAIAFPVGVDINGNIQIAEGNHRLTAALEVAKETGKNIYVPIYVYPGGTQVGSQEAAYRGKFRTVNPQDLHSALYQLFIDVGADEYSANEKVGKEFNTVKQYTGSNYLGAGGSGGNSTSQENIKKFFDAIGVNTYTYRNLPEDNIFKTGVNPLIDTTTTSDLEELIKINRTTDTPITTEPALLETRFKYEFTQIPDDTPRGYSVIKNKPQWQYDVVKPNKIFHPSKMTSAFGSLSKDGKEIINAYVKGTMTDKQATRLFIFLASHSDLPAWGFGKSYSARDAIGDIAKIGIMSDRPLDRVLPMGEPFMEKEFLNKIAMRNSDFFQAFDANAIKSEQLALRMLVDMQMERGQFTNFKERMRQVLIDEHNKIYRQNPNDYFILWRGGGLNRFNTWQSFSKRQEAAMGVMLQVKQQGAGQGGKLETYVLSKNNFIDLDSLGLSHGNEQEVIVLTEAAIKPGAKIPDGLDDAKQIDAYIDSWAIRASEPEFYPKKGFAITNISQQLNQLGQGTQQFFTDVIQGMGDQAPQKAYEQLIDFNNKQLDTAQDIYNKFVVQGGDFNQHIFTSIPTFYEAQIVKGVALSNMLNNFEKVNVTSESPKIKVLDIGATEGTWSKLLGSLNSNLEVDVLEPNPAAKKIFEESDQVDNVFFRQNAFSYLPEDQGKYFMEEGGSRNINFFNFGAGEDVQFKYDVVHESMTFQFLDSNRKAQINFIAENVLNDNGILIIEEKFDVDDAVGQYNEQLKNDWKSQYYTPEQLNSKQNQVLTEMGRNQISRLEMETILNTKFKYVNQYWSSGNFAGFVASNNPLADTFVDEINALDISLTNHEFSTNPTDEEIKYAVKKQVEGTGINPDLHKAVVADMVDKNAGFINKVTDGLLGIYKGARSVGLAALGLGLKGLSKAAPVLEPGDVLIEKALQKSTPQIGKYASRLGFGFLPIRSIVPNYMALEIGMAAAEFVSAAMYAYSDYAKAQKGGYMYEYQNIDGKTRYVPVRQEDGTPVYQPALNTYDFFRTPPGQEAIKDFNYNDFFLKELEKERVTQYSPGWSLSKAIFGLFGTMVDEQAKLSEQTRGDVGQALLTGIGK